MDKLAIYNGALRILGERATTLVEERAPRRYLDEAWEENAHDSWLEVADWNFAMAFVKIQKDAAADVKFGYTNEFSKPTDLVRVSGVWVDEYQENPLRRYIDEGNKFYSDQEDLYVAYVCNSSTLGGDLGNWPNSFARYVQAFLANEIAPRLKNDGAMDLATKELDRRLTEALSRDAMKNPSKQLPQGRWAGARGGRNYRDGFTPI